MSRIARLAKFIGLVESSDAVLIKHLAGQHDQSTHGNWAEDAFDDLATWAETADSEIATDYDKRDAVWNRTLRQQVKNGFSAKTHPEFLPAIELYLSEDGYEINKLLRTGFVRDFVTLSFNDAIDGLDTAIDEAPPLEKPVIAYRGVKGAGLDFFENLKIGDSFEDKGYASTTLSATTASEDFAGADYGDGMVLQMHLPEGTQCLFPSEFVGDDGFTWSERELLLPRDSIFKVTNIRGRIIDMEVEQ